MAGYGRYGRDLESCTSGGRLHTGCKQMSVVSVGVMSQGQDKPCQTHRRSK